jgi:ADP-ribosyl-[dinitrogen reductase] hydrolase
LPFEGLGAAKVARRLKQPPRYQLIGHKGFVSDDTEQTALVAQALAKSSSAIEPCERHLRRSLIGWFWRLPFGIGLATIKACLKMTLGLRRSGARSAGNGAAMRAAIVGAYLNDQPERRRALGRTLAMLTHRDERAIQAALFVAEIAAAASVTQRSKAISSTDRLALVEQAMGRLTQKQLIAAIERGVDCAIKGLAPIDAAAQLGNSGFCIHSVAICSHCFAHADLMTDPLDPIRRAILCGGDTDTHAAIVGGWVGALCGARALPSSLLQKIEDGPFGPSHLLKLAKALAFGGSPPPWSPIYAMVRNLALYPVVLGHGFARLVR